MKDNPFLNQSYIDESTAIYESLSVNDYCFACNEIMNNNNNPKDIISILAAIKSLGNNKFISMYNAEGIMATRLSFLSSTLEGILMPNLRTIGQRLKEWACSEGPIIITVRLKIL